MIFLAAAFAAVAAQAQPSEAGPLAALARRAAGEIARIAQGRAVDLETPEEATGGVGLARELQSMMAARLTDRRRDAAGRVHVTSAFARSATRLRLAGRVTADPDGELVDVFAVSVDAGNDVASPSARAAFSLTATTTSGPLPGRVLDLAFLDESRLVVLFADSVALYRREGAAISRLDDVALAVTSPVRAPAGIIVSGHGESAFWVATNLAEGAVLMSVEGQRLRETDRAPVLPLAGAGRGGRFRPGTNLIDVEIAGLGAGPYLRISGIGARLLAVAPDGRLGLGAEWTDTRAGSAADLGAGTLATTSPLPPATEDAIVVRDATTPLLTIPIAGSVTALAARPGTGAIVAAGVTNAGVHRLLVLDLARAE
jgi:hypothetical protein